MESISERGESYVYLVYVVYCPMDDLFNNRDVYWRILYVSQVFKKAAKGRWKVDFGLARSLHRKKTLHLWDSEQKQLLNDLVEPVPELFRDVAKGKIAGKIGEIALEEKAKTLTQDHIIRGYILATPKRDHKFLIKKLKEKEIDMTPYRHLLESS